MAIRGPSGTIESIELQSGRAILNVRHLTAYRYARPVEFGDHRMMMRPRDGHDQRLLSSELEIDPEPRRLRWLYDTFDNCVAIASFSGAWTSLTSRTGSRSTGSSTISPAAKSTRGRTSFPFPTPRTNCPTSPGRSNGSTATRRGDLDRWVRQFVVAGRDDADQPPADDDDLCDQGRVLLRAARGAGRAVAAPYARAAVADLPRFRGADDGGGARRSASRRVSSPAICTSRAATNEPVRLGGGATHAWCQIYLPGAGWIEFDPTNGLVGGKDLIRVAVARDPAQTAPLTGAYFGESRATNWAWRFRSR